MDRRTFIGTLSSGLLAAPLTAGAQPVGKVYRIGFLDSQSARLELLPNALRSVGLVEGRNVVIERRTAKSEDQDLAVAKELVQLNPDVIVALRNRDVVAARQATQSIPIVMVFGVNPVGAGLVASLAHPGGNVTGSLISEPSIAGKMLLVLKELVPTMKRVGVLWNPGFTPLAYYAQMEIAARTSGMTLESFESREAKEFDSALGRIAASRPGGLFVDGFAVFRREDRPRLIEFAARHALPTLYTGKFWVEMGGLISYSASNEEAWHRTARYVDRILKGAKPADLPVEGPTKFDLVLNFRTAKALALTIPQSLLLRADEVIE